MYYLYCITNLINNKVYVGQSVDNKVRWRQHKYFSKNPGKSGQYIHRAMNKYGIENFKFDIVAISITQDGANETEKILIQQYNSRDKKYGYNISPGGDCAWNRGLPKEMQPMYGKHCSDETKRKISTGNLGKIMPSHTQEWKDNMSAIMTGRILTEEWKKNISDGNKGKILTEESKEKISISMTGRTLSEEHKNNIAKSCKGIIGPRAEKCGNAKLNWELVREIRKEFSKGNTSKNKLAKKYQVSQPTITQIVEYKTWKE